ncbi:MAG: putative Ig domain-containing protein [Pseudomonadota bacterium]
MGKISGIVKCLAAALICFTAGWLPAPASAADDSVCAEVKIEIAQELTLERQAFDAHMRINNGLAHITLDRIHVAVNFSDADGNVVTATSDPDADPEATGHKFFIAIDTMENISDVDGGGQIAPSTSADIHWRIIPVPGASGGILNGKMFYVGATLTYEIGGEENTTQVTPDYIFVKPMPELVLDYFLPHDVYGDDAFTADVTEPPVPFSLGLRVKNTGFGAAKNLAIDSGQPRIVENEQGLLVGFVITGSEVNGAIAPNRLNVALGDIAPGAAGMARWIMTCSLSGTFESFSAGFSHADALGGQLTSLIRQENLHTHFLVRDVLVDLPGRDVVRDFLAKENPDSPIFRVFESNGTESEVTDVSTGAALQLLNQSGTEIRYSLQVSAPGPGFLVAVLPDPGGGARRIKSVVRSDGKIIKTDNAWLSKTRLADHSWQHFFNLFDAASTGAYTVVFDDSAPASAPVLATLTDQSGVETQPFTINVAATDADGTVPALTAAPLPAGAGFADHGDGTGTFSWTPTIGQAGGYSIVFTATDGALEATRRISVTIFPADDTDGDGMDDAWEQARFGSLERDGSGDFDGDGISDLLEFRLGTNPGAIDHAPSVPVISLPAIGSVVTGTLPSLTVFNSTDADGDALTYDFEVFADHRLTQSVAAAGHVAEGAGLTAWPLPVELEDNHSFYWRVRAGDGYSYSAWVYGEFTVNTGNNAPGAPVISLPAAGDAVDSLTPYLEVGNASDADGDALVYYFEVFADDQAADAVVWATNLPAGAGGTTGWTVPTALSDQTTYYWRAIAEDPSGARTATALVAFTVDTTNAAPSAPVIAGPLPGTEVADTTVTLVAGNGVDPEGASLVYIFEIDTTATFAGPERQSFDPVSETAAQTTFTAADLSDNTLYFWRVRAHDGAAGSAWATGQFFVNPANDAPAVPVVKNPGNGAWASASAPLLEAAPALDPEGDGVTYAFEVFADADLLLPVASGAAATPAWQADPALENNTLYYWRVRAEDSLGAAGDWSAAAALFIRDLSTLEPAQIAVNVTTDKGRALSGVRIYAFTEAGAYTGKNAVTDETGAAVFLVEDFAEGRYRFRADYLGGQFWSADTLLPVATVSLVIAEETVTVDVSGAGDGAGVRIYLFSEAGAYLGINVLTDANGQVTFDLPTDRTFKFRADVMGHQYWGQIAVSAAGANLAEVASGGGTFTVTVQEAPGLPMEGTRVYLFTAAGAYLNQNLVTDANGRVAFLTPEGNYKVRADYLGYQFWSADALVATDTTVDLSIPHQDVTVEVSGVMAQATPVAGVKAYLFTETGAYMNQHLTTDAAGQVVFHLPERAYKVRADYLAGQFWSPVFTAQNADVDIPMADAVITVGWSTITLPAVPVYAFTEAGAYLNLTAASDGDGHVTFRLPADTGYKFRADYQASQYWSDPATLAAGVANPVAITAGGGTFALTVKKDADTPLVGVNAYVFSDTGAYFGMFGPTSSEGVVTFDLASGVYDIRVDYLGYQFWTNDHAVPAALAAEFTIAHQMATATVSGLYDGVRTPLAGVNLYLFTAAGAYQNRVVPTDSLGTAAFYLPEQAYKVRADFMGQQFWSQEVTGEDFVVDVPMADATITVTGGGAPLAGVPVYVFTGAGAYLNLNAPTAANGKVVFRLPAGDYNFRADYQNSQFWSSPQSLAADMDNPVEVNTGGGTFALTVLRGENTPLTGARCYVFTAGGAYLGKNEVTSSEGQVSFPLADGSYKIRVDHLGYQYWTSVFDVPVTLSNVFTIAHQDVSVSIEKYHLAAEPLAGVRVYLFTAGGAYQNQNLITSAEGTVVFSLPGNLYKARADYMGQQFWSASFNQQNVAVSIPHGEADVIVLQGEVGVENARVYVFTGAGSYLNQNALTGAAGHVAFVLPAGAYKFRADFGGQQFWSPAVTVTGGASLPVDIPTE